jgi:MFS family permease
LVEFSHARESLTVGGLPTPLRRQVALLRRATNFRLLFLATLGSSVGTWMATVALTVDVKNRTNSAWWVSALLMVSFLPSVVVGLAAGPLVDRLSRKNLLVVSDVTRMIVFGVLPFVGSALAILVLAAIAGVANSFFRPALLAGMPNLVEEDDLAHGTSLLQAVDWAAMPLGSLLGGVIVSVWNPHPVYWINAISFLASAILIVRISARFLQSEQGITRGHWSDLREGIGAFRRSPALRTALLSLGIGVVAVGFVNVSEVFLATRSLHAGSFGFGLLWAVSGVGLVGGSLLTGSLLERRDVVALYPLGFLPWALGILVAALAPDIWVAALGMVVGGVGNGIAFPMTVLIVQRWTVDRLRGRAFTVIISAHNALLGVAMIAAGALTTGLGARWVYGFASALLGIGSLTALVLGRRVVAGTVLEQAA